MIHPKFQDLDIEVSQPMKLEAEVTGHPAPLVEWQLNGVKVDRSRRVALSKDKNIHALSIQKTAKEDSGEYKIIAKNKVSSTSFTANVNIFEKEKEEPPKFIKSLKDLTVNDRDFVKFEVEIENCDKVIWLLDENELEDDEDFQFQQAGNVYIFSIQSIDVADEGFYECHATNKYGTSKSSCKLNVSKREETPAKDLELPKITSNIADDVLEYETDAKLELSFEIATSSSTEINVYKNEDLIEAGDEHLQIVKKGSIVKLKIDKLATGDSGFYVIEAENEAGLTEKEIEIKVKGKRV